MMDYYQEARKNRDEMEVVYLWVSGPFLDVGLDVYEACGMVDQVMSWNKWPGRKQPFGKSNEVVSRPCEYTTSTARPN